MNSKKNFLKGTEPQNRRQSAGMGQKGAHAISLTALSLTVVILEFNPHIMRMLSPKLLNHLHHGNIQTAASLKTK